MKLSFKYNFKSNLKNHLLLSLLSLSSFFISCNNDIRVPEIEDNLRKNQKTLDSLYYIAVFEYSNLYPNDASNCMYCHTSDSKYQYIYPRYIKCLEEFNGIGIKLKLRRLLRHLEAYLEFEKQFRAFNDEKNKEKQ